MLMRIVWFALFILASSGAVSAGEIRVQRVAGGHAEVSLPAELIAMDEAARRAKYPNASGQTDVFTDATGMVSFVAGIQASSIHSVNLMMAALTDGLKRSPGVEAWHDNGTRTINGRRFGFVEFTARASQASVYNYIYFTPVGDQMMIFTVNCTTDKLDAWKPVLLDVVASTRVIEAP